MGKTEAMAKRSSSATCCRSTAAAVEGVELPHELASGSWEVWNAAKRARARQTRKDKRFAEKKKLQLFVDKSPAKAKAVPAAARSPPHRKSLRS